jgi:hypothetical protein
MWFQLLLEKLDPDTRKLFESDICVLGPAEIAKFKQLADFTEGQCRVLDSLGKPREPASTTNSSRKHDVESEIGFYSGLITSKLCTVHLQTSGVYAENFATTV